MPAANALVSLDEVRAYLQRDSQDVDSDDILETLIDAASEAIIQWTGREFAPASDDVERVFEYDGSGLLSLAPYDLRSVTSIEMDGGTTLTTSDYSLRPATPRQGVYTFLRLPRRFGESEVTVTGDWGFAAVPANVKLAACIQVAHTYRSDVAAFSRAFDPVAQQWQGGEGLTSTVKSLLALYKNGRVS